MNLNDTDFELFAVPPTFAQDRAALDARWKELQREAHPDPPLELDARAE